MLPGSAVRGCAHPESASPSLMVVVDHHGAENYHIDLSSSDASKQEIRPYDPHRFLNHLAHKGQSEEKGQRAPEDIAFYKRIADAVAAGGKIIAVDHGTGKSNAARHLTEYLRTHHHEPYQRVVSEVTTNLSSITQPQLLVLAKQRLRRRRECRRSRNCRPRTIDDASKTRCSSW